MNEPDILETNSELVRKFAEIEADLAGCTGIAELFERLLLGSRAAFGVPFVWLSVIRTPETEALIGLLGESDLLRERINVIGPETFLEICPDTGRPFLATGDLHLFFRLMPPREKYLLRSLAIAPLSRDGHLIGSLNHGGASPDRYRPGMETGLLDHLARTISEQLSRLMPPC
jgi:uncharacterized protein YigA (DUF484 family)